MSFFKRMKKSILDIPMRKIDKNKKFPLQMNLKYNLEQIKKNLGDSEDLVTRVIHFGKKRALQAGVIYIDGLVDRKSIQRNILEPT